MAKRKPFEPKPELEAANAAAIEEAEAIEAPVVLTVNGKPIPAEFAHAIPYAMTDQGQAEARARDRATGNVPSGVSVTSDAWDKQLDRKAEAQIWESYDPLREAVDTVREPGMTYRFLSDRLAKRRGRRGWETVTDKDGKAVQVAGMTLGKMPTKRAETRNEHYREEGETMLQHAAEQYELDQAKAIRDAKVKGIAPLRAGEQIVDNHRHPGMVTNVGVQTTRGIGADAAE